MLELISKFGLEKALKKVEGMFAFGLWDKKDEKLFLVRDRFGEKPLYYGYNNGTFYFTSELKSLFGNKNFKPTISKKSFNVVFSILSEAL